jgi:hypothetical protein
MNSLAMVIAFGSLFTFGAISFLSPTGAPLFARFRLLIPPLIVASATESGRAYASPCPEDWR